MEQKARGPGALVSIIVPCFNQLRFTRLCVTALYRHTRPPWELIVVDNGSTDGTAGYLQGVRDASPVAVEIVTNSENRGFPAACNQGMRAARGEYMVLLNNDAVVTDGWLDRQVALAESDPAIGMVGPMSNYVTGSQWVRDVPYSDLDGMHRFAARWATVHRGSWSLTHRLVGFCLLIKRSVVETVGDLDERFGLGLFDDDDLSLRVARVGYRLAVAEDVFVHHFGGRTFEGSGFDTAALALINESVFASKWGAGTGSGLARRERGRASSPMLAGTGGRRLRVTLTMIVRDEEANLADCLESAAGLFDEVVIVDTGSADRTIEIARRFGARVFDFVWVDDFAAARNSALARATGDYCFWLDADERIEPAERVRLKSFLDHLNETEAAYSVHIAGAAGDSDGVVDAVRLVPCREDVRWAGRVHEQIVPALRRAGLRLESSEVSIWHVGDAGSPSRRLKQARNARISALARQEQCADPSEATPCGPITERPGAAAHSPDWDSVEWLVAGSRRQVVPSRGPGDFDPYVPLATEWVRVLEARVVVELGVRFGVSTRALLAGARSVGGHVWGVDPLDQHGIVDPCFTFVRADAGEATERWAAIDLLHIDTDPHTEEQTLRWFAQYAAKCRAIALHDTHHPEFGVGAAVRAFVAGGEWNVYEYWGNASGWTVLVRRGAARPSAGGEEAS